MLALLAIHLSVLHCKAVTESIQCANFVCSVIIVLVQLLLLIFRVRDEVVTPKTKLLNVAWLQLKANHALGIQGRTAESCRT